jgi:hypothetical protein
MQLVVAPCTAGLGSVGGRALLALCTCPDWLIRGLCSPRLLMPLNYGQRQRTHREEHEVLQVKSVRLLHRRSHGTVGIM